MRYLIDTGVFFMKPVGYVCSLFLVAMLLMPTPVWAQAPESCVAQHIVQPGDSLLKIADKYYGDRTLYHTIVTATNTIAETDSSFARIENPSFIRPGWKVCLPEINGRKPRADGGLDRLTDTGSINKTQFEPGVSVTPETSAPLSQSELARRQTKLVPEAVTFTARSLASDVVGAVMPAAPYDASSPPGPVGNPEYVAFLFDGLERMRVFPVKPYEALWNAAGDPTVSNNISQLQNTLAGRPRLPETPFPFLPPATGYNDLAAQVQFLDFAGGSGLRFVGRFAQSVGPVVNADLKYIFQGLTNDGDYYVSFDYPVSAAGLPDKVSDLSSSEQLKVSEDFQTYLTGIQEQLNGLNPTDFSPSLLDLDTLIKSMRLSLPPSAQASGALNNATWRLEEIQEASGKTVVLDEAERYTLEFLPDGAVSIRADCNYGRGRYSAQGQQLTIEVTVLTKAMCPLDSLSDMYVRLLNEATSYVLLNDSLFISYGIDGGVLKFGNRG